MKPVTTHWRYRLIAAKRHLAHFFQCVADKNMRHESGFCGFLLNLVKVHLSDIKFVDLKGFKWSVNGFDS